MVPSPCVGPVFGWGYSVLFRESRVATRALELLAGRSASEKATTRIRIIAEASARAYRLSIYGIRNVNRGAGDSRRAASEARKSGETCGVSLRMASIWTSIAFQRLTRTRQSS